MMHQVLLAVAAALVAVTAATSARLRRRGRDLPTLGYIVGGALVVGNAACLLPTTPGWYSTTMLVLSVAGLLWYVASVATVESSDDTRASEAIYAGRMPTRPLPSRPALRVVPAERVEPARVVPAELAPPAAHAEPAVRAATQATFDAAGAAGSRAAAGQATYVAANLDRYIDARRTRRAHGEHRPRSHSGDDPTARFLRLARAYEADDPRRSRGWRA